MSYQMSTTSKANVYNLPKKRQSYVWEHFTGEGTFATCNYCFKQVKYCGGTSNLQAHLKRCELMRPQLNFSASNVGPPKLEDDNQDSYDSVEILPDQRETVLIPKEPAIKRIRRSINQNERISSSSTSKPAQFNKNLNQLNKVTQQHQTQQSQQNLNTGHTLFPDYMFTNNQTSSYPSIQTIPEVISDGSIDGNQLTDAYHEENSYGSAETGEQSSHNAHNQLLQNASHLKISNYSSGWIPSPTHSLTQQQHQHQQKKSKLKQCLPPSDHLKSFFKAMEDTVRTFTRVQQADIKNQIFAIISKVEMSNLVKQEEEENKEKQVQQEMNGNDAQEDEEEEVQEVTEKEQQNGGGGDS